LQHKCWLLTARPPTPNSYQPTKREYKKAVIPAFLSFLPDIASDKIYLADMTTTVTLIFFSNPIPFYKRVVFCFKYLEIEPFYRAVPRIK